MKTPGLVAHRGYASHFPENSIVGIGAAIEAGARAVEFDVQFSADRVAVLFHDRDMMRVCGIAGAIHEHELSQLRKIPASEPERLGDSFTHTRIATLEDTIDMLMHHPGVTLFVEVKRVAIEQFGIHDVLSGLSRELAPVREHCVLISFDYAFMLAARRDGWAQVGVVLEHWRDRKSTIVRQIQPDFLFCNYKKLPRFFPVNKGNAKLVLYEIDDPRLAIKLVRRGADYIETFSIGEMRKALA
jgi:glycerophosphoryl diester phosphodiesterase